MMKPLPSGPWEALFPRAVLLIDEIERYGGASDPFWTLGGGTVLMFRYGHLEHCVEVAPAYLSALGHP